ncbi:cell surface protein SprA [Fulvivirgaceae bacterium BMA12]|uniref:Cell surface protein SprA n=1 Tax=Agaribacillus aureus TaxID=3051825 RepID=A0ABT8LBZ3_9BACT|nr:cell surface protein SprA [Fulvivirgaceae bacterium BMA12]
MANWFWPNGDSNNSHPIVSEQEPQFQYYLIDTTGSDSTQNIQGQDTIKTDSAPAQPYQPTRQPTFKPKDRYGDPFSFDLSPSPLLLKDPSGLLLDVEIDTGLNYTIYEKMGDVNFRPTSSMSFDEFSAYQERKILKDYWKSRSRGLDGESPVSSRSLIPPLYVSPIFDRIFGGSRVDIVPSGFVTLDFGSRFQRIFNPSIPIRQQRNTTPLEFDQQITMNVVGSIGEKLKVTTNFDNNNSFDFENNFKVEYTGFEEDIIKKIEIGNVSLPLNNSLITGSQNLFGFKTQLQFGKLFVTALASTQRGKTDVVEINGGSGGGQAREFEIRGSNYDENRHFFLGHFFRDNYQNWLQGIPQITSGVNITRIEVYVINRNNTTETLRNFAAFMDLGEASRIYNNTGLITANNPNAPNSNSANSLFSTLRANNEIRNPDRVIDVLENQLNLVNATEFNVVTSARKLDQREFSFHPQLGYVSLFRQLQNDEVLAVSYEYTFNGQRYQVGELQDDYQSRRDDEIIILKMLRPSKINIRDPRNRAIPTWDLMMKNIYNLNASQVTRDNFQLRVIYRDDRTGIDNPSLHEGINTQNVPLVELLDLDRLNQQGDEQPDGNFDFVDGITIDTEKGNVIFPVLEPFGEHLRSFFIGDPNQQNLINKFVFDTLYASTKFDAQRNTLLDKFFIKGSLQAGSSSEIPLPGINIAEGSVKVIAGNTPLTEGVDYQVDYTFGKVTIINEGILNSGRPIKITYEKSDLFNFQARSLFGARFDYRFSEDFNLGATVLHLNERPLVSRISVGDEPLQNTKYGFDINYRKDSRFLTKLTDALPFIQTKEKSTITFNGEFAQLLPGTSNIVDGDGTSYLDDFEAAVTPFSLGSNILTWKLGSTPVTDDNIFGADAPSGDLSFGYRRAKIAWYIIDNIFYRNGGPNVPSNLTEEDLENHYVREVIPQEIFPRRSQQVINPPLPLFNIAYFPSERGQYNYNPQLNPDGSLPDPTGNWGGITRAITSEVDFDKANIEFIEFWMLDPFLPGENGRVIDGIENRNNTTGGRLVLNLGSISEDMIKDNKHGFENGLPADGSDENIQLTPWGRVTTQQFLTEQFDNSTSARPNQDVGLDGLRNEDEAANFADFLNNIPPSARAIVEADPSADNFQFYLSPELDNAKVLERYKNFNGMEGNTPVISGNASITPSGSNLPENEDLNKDNTLSSLEEYYEYTINLRPGELEVGKENIVDRVTANVNGDVVNWYLFRIPIRKPDNVVGSINDFKSIRYLRTYLTGFSQPVVLRMANFQMVGSQWIKETANLESEGFGTPNEFANTEFNITVVNIEENSEGGSDRIPYTLPPGIRRDRDNTTVNQVELNEQSLKLTVKELEDRDARGVFKNVNFDLINYGNIRMFLHADGENVRDAEATAFLRLGTDKTQNYYEIEVPLVITQIGDTDPELIWPEQNEINVSLDELFQLKSLRNRTNEDRNFRFSNIQGLLEVGQTRLTIKGNPDLSSVQVMMLGIRNPESPDKAPKSLCIWANELRVGDFDTRAGWAANARLNAQLADFANVTASTRYTSVGFGSIQEKIAQREREETTQFDVAANVNLDKFFPEKLGLSIPMYVGYEKVKVKPFFDPKDPDVPLKSTLNSMQGEERDNYEDIVTDNTERKSINFTNVRVNKTNPEAKNRIYDLSNFSFTYAFSEETRSNFNMESYLFRTYKGAVGYNFAPQELSVEPFQKAKFLNSPYLKLLKDFNFSPIPNNVSVRFDLDRRFIKTQFRNENLTTEGIAPNFEKYFTFNRIYNVRWNLTKGLSLDYAARANAVIDEPDGEIDTSEERQEVWENLKNLGRMKNFNQDISFNYRVPLDKIPFTDWVRADARYSVGYTWTAGALNQIEEFGNVIQNNRQRSVTGKFDLVGLYNKIKFFKEINSPTPARRGRPQTKQNEEKEEEDALKRDNKGVKGFLRLLMSVRSIDFTYNVGEGTYLPGFNKTAFLFGMDSAFSAPGIPFLLGSQDVSIRERAFRKGWLVNSEDLTTPFSQSNNIDLNVNAIVEPFKDFRITLKARKQKTNAYQEIYRNGESLNPSRTGSYSISFFTLKTAFKRDDSNDVSPVFQDFENNRQEILNRLARANEDLANLALNSQDVLIPAFIAAYTGQDVNKVNLTPFPKMPVPNWTLSYAGLSKLNGLKDIFRSITLNHSYNSSYDVRNFTSSLFYEEGITLDKRVEDYRPPSLTNDNGDFVPELVLNQVSITESFAPLIGVNLSTKKRMNINVEYKTERSLALTLSNAQITELTRNDFSLTFGYTKAKFKLPFRSQGKTITLENDLSFKMQMSLGDNKTVQRKIEDSNTVTNGTKSFQLRPTIDYVVNEKLSVQIYFERNVNEPKVSASFKRATTAFGTRIRFSLSQ